MKTATYSNHGPMRGLVVMLRPEVKGAQRWRVIVTVRKPLPDGWSEEERISVLAPEPLHLGAMREIVLGEISRALGGVDDCRVSMEFFVPGRRS